MQHLFCLQIYIFCFSIGVTILTHQESHCLQYAGFKYINWFGWAQKTKRRFCVCLHLSTAEVATQKNILMHLLYSQACTESLKISSSIRTYRSTISITITM